MRYKRTSLEHVVQLRIAVLFSTDAQSLYTHTCPHLPRFSAGERVGCIHRVVLRQVCLVLSGCCILCSERAGSSADEEVGWRQQEAIAFQYGHRLQGHVCRWDAWNCICKEVRQQVRYILHSAISARPFIRVHRARVLLLSGSRFIHEALKELPQGSSPCRHIWI